MELNDQKFDASMEAILKLLHELCTLLKAKNRIDGETLLDNQDLCFLLKISKRSLQRYRSIGILHYMQIGAKIFYKESDVERFIEEHIRYKDKDEEEQS